MKEKWRFIACGDDESIKSKMAQVSRINERCQLLRPREGRRMGVRCETPLGILALECRRFRFQLDSNFLLKCSLGGNKRWLSLFPAIHTDNPDWIPGSCFSLAQFWHLESETVNRSLYPSLTIKSAFKIKINVRQ